MSNQDDSWWNRKPLTEVNHRTRKILLTTLVVVWGGLLLLSFADEIGGTQSMTVFDFFLILSLCVIVHNLRQISKSLRILVDSQQKEQG